MLDALGRHPLFMAAALAGESLAAALQSLRAAASSSACTWTTPCGSSAAASSGCAAISPRRCSCPTPTSYEGGELTVEDTYGAHAVKLAAGDLILYPASSLHHVTPVTSGERVASFFWVQSMIRDDAQRRVLFDMDVAVQRLAGELGQAHASVVALTGTYHNLLRMWAEV